MLDYKILISSVYCDYEMLRSYASVSYRHITGSFVREIVFVLLFSNGPAFPGKYTMAAGRWDKENNLAHLKYLAFEFPALFFTCEKIPVSVRSSTTKSPSLKQAKQAR